MDATSDPRMEVDADVEDHADASDGAAASSEPTGRGVTVAILDRGIDWRHPDFIDDSGQTRIEYILDMSGQDHCNASNPAPVEYDAVQINGALAAGSDLATRDAVGHGTATAGAAAGNGRALADGHLRSLAPDAKLLIVKVTSEGVAGGEAPFSGCLEQALDWIDTRGTSLGQPVVAILNSGTQYGPIDGTSAESAAIDRVFGLDRPGWTFVVPSGDEGGLPSHAGGQYDSAGDTVVRLTKATDRTTYGQLWYTGSLPAEIELRVDDGTVAGPVGPGETALVGGISLYHYAPSTDPWGSSSGDGALGFILSGYAGTGQLTIRGLGAGQGRFDAYSDLAGSVFLTPDVTFTDHLVAGRLSDIASTRGAIVVGNHVARESYVDIDGIARNFSAEGRTGELWVQSSEGPTRDGRDHGVDVTAAGQTTFAALAKGSYWASLRGNQPKEGQGWYVRFGGTSGAAPIVVGAVARMLEVDPTLTAREVRDHLRASARADSNTGSVPNTRWGFGKLDVDAAVARVRAAAP